MTENVELGSLKADIRETERTKCLNIPRAKVPDHKFSKPQMIFFALQVACTDSKVNKRFVVNRVVCDQRRKTNVCRSIPWSIPTPCHSSPFYYVMIFHRIILIIPPRSQCTPGSGQECRMVQRTRCVPVCNKSPMCSR